MTKDISGTGREQVALDLSNNKVIRKFPCHEAPVPGNFVGCSLLVGVCEIGIFSPHANRCRGAARLQSQGPR